MLNNSHFKLRKLKLLLMRMKQQKLDLIINLLYFSYKTEKERLLVIVSVGLEKNSLLLEMLLKPKQEFTMCHRDASPCFASSLWAFLFQSSFVCKDYKSTLKMKTSEALRFTRANISAVIPGFCYYLF